MRTIENQFPDYDGEFPLLEGFADTSWKNDVCPSQTRELTGGRLLRVWFDYVDEGKRECEGGKTYTVDISENDVQTPIFESDDLSAVREFLKDLR